MNELKNFLEALHSLKGLKSNYVEMLMLLYKHNSIDNDEHQDLIILFQLLDNLD